MSRDTVILGAGLAGLSAAHRLEERGAGATLLEREDRVGGLTRSFSVDGFTFDLTGHLLHLRRPEIIALIDRILPDGMASIDRRSYIHSHGVYTDYPFQANLHGLPAEVVEECLLGFIEAEGRKLDPAQLEGASFEAWARATFGDGMARHFMLPYNRKLWCRDPSEITADWVSWAVPRPRLEEVVAGALGRTNRGLGYNPTFRYPVAGGIEVLPRALHAGLQATDLHLKTEVARVDLDRRRVETTDGRVWPFESLISTLPLPRLVALLEGAPAEIRQAAAGLSATRVVNINLGIARADLTHRHWTYFPEDQFVFYRVGSPTAFCRQSAPQGCSSLYIEIARPDATPADAEALMPRVRDDLVRCGLLRQDDDIVARHVAIIDPAYVVFDRHRQEHLPGILRWLEDRAIHSVGRYGRWEYGSMESAMVQGLEVAGRLAGPPPGEGLEVPCPPSASA